MQDYESVAGVDLLLDGPKLEIGCRQTPKSDVLFVTLWPTHARLDTTVTFKFASVLLNLLRKQIG